MNKYDVQMKSDELQAGFFQPEAFHKKAVQIKVLETAVAGMNFHVENEKERDNLQKLVPGTELKLYREADNEYDEWAIGVYYDEEDKVGYVTRYKNETIARLMDCGKKFIAIVDESREAKDIHQGNKAPTERGVPISIYLVEE